MKCARKTRAGERRKPMARGKGGGWVSVHVPENWPPCRLPSLSLSLSLFLFLSPSPLPAVNATACMHRATTRYRPLHFSSLRANAWTEEETRRRNRREMRRKRGDWRNRGSVRATENEIVARRSLASLALVLRIATFVVAANVRRDRVDLT